MRKKRFQVTCFCDAYKFPHRFGGGKCNGLNIVESCFNSRSLCIHCNLFSVSGCEVLNGLESTKECPAVQDFLNYNEVKL